jgi:DNA repair exonuclease SbcCD ATPase subunit
MVGWARQLITRFVGACVGIFVLAVGFVVVSHAQDFAALFEALRAEPLTQKLAWFVIVLIPLALIPSAIWLCDVVIRQRKAADELELRLGGIRHASRELGKTQIDADAAIHHLARTDPETAIGDVTARLTEAERVLHVQQSRNEVGDLQAKVDTLRVQQQDLRERLVPALEKRRSIEQLFAELDSREADIDRALSEIASGDDAIAIDIRLKQLMDFVRKSHERCDEIEQALKTVAGLKEDYGGLRERLAPFVAAKDGVAHRVKELNETHDRLTADIDALQKTPQGSLDARVQNFADAKIKIDDSVSNLDLQFSKLASLHADLERVSSKLDRALERLGRREDGDAKDPVASVSEFVSATQVRFAEIERTMGLVGELRAKLGELQSRMVPMEASDGGVADLLAQVKDIRDRLIAKIDNIEAGEDGDLATRVKNFIKTKQELEKRVSGVTDNFSKLATIRKDIAGLFDKLSNAADNSSN